MSPTLWLATSALLRALSGPVDSADETDAEETAIAHADAAGAPSAAISRPASCREQIPAGPTIHMAEEGEPGQRLVVVGRVLGAWGNPAAGVTVYAYQADVTGRYSAKRSGPDDNQNPRLCGVLKTDAAGNFRIESIRPGAYGGGGTAHIHFEVWGDKLSRRHFMLTFDERKPGAGQGVDSAVRSGDRSATQRPVVRDAHGVWQCLRDLRLS